jgi:hypothetical protein
VTRAVAVRQIVRAVAFALLVAVALAGPILAADASATPGAGGGDPRSPGQGPGLVGDPAFALGAVLVVAVLSVGLTLAWVRLTGPSKGTPGR